MRTIPLTLAIIVTIFLPDDLSAQVVTRDTIPQYAPFVITDASMAAPKSDAALPVSDAVLLQLQLATVETILGHKPHAMQIQMPMDDGTIRRLDLKRFELLAPGAQIMRGTDLGDEEISMAFASYTGTVEGIPDSWVSMNFTRKGVRGMIGLGSETYTVEPLREEAGYPDHAHMLYRESSLESPAIEGGVEAVDIPEQLQRVMPSMMPALMPAVRDFTPGIQGLLTAQIAIESDWEMYVFFDRDVEEATGYLLSLMAMVSQAFEQGMDIKLLVTFTRVWTTPLDPYTSSGDFVQAPSPFELQDEFRDYWNENMNHVERDLAHFITNRTDTGSGVGGNILCSDQAYSFSNVLQFGAPRRDVWIVAHETGHNFGAPHTHDCAWPAGPGGTLAPIDRCRARSRCDGPEVDQAGTIMSYCRLSGYPRMFHPLVGNLIRARAEAASCIGGGIEEHIYTIEGNVTVDGVGQEGVNMIVAALGSIVSNTMTDAEGNFTLSNLASDTYVVSANLENNVFIPFVQDLIVAGVNVSGINFEAGLLVPDGWEPDNMVQDAKSIPTDGTDQYRSIHDANDRDVISFAALAGQEYWIQTFRPEMTTFLIRLLDSDGASELASSVEDAGIETSILWEAPSSGTYFIEVTGELSYYRVWVVRVATFNPDNPAVLFDHYELFVSVGNQDGVANPGEFLYLHFFFTNATNETLSDAYAVLDDTQDAFVNPIDAYFSRTRVDLFTELASGETSEGNLQRAYFHIDGDTPDGHVLQIPMQIFDGNNELIGQHVLQVPVSGTDTTSPETFDEIYIQPGAVAIGETVTIQAFVFEAGEVASITADIEQPDETVVATVTLFDDGQHNDFAAGDRWFAGQYTPQTEADFFVDISATDDKGNTGGFDNATFTTKPFVKQADILLVADNDRAWVDDFQQTYGGAFDDVGYRYDIWQTWQRGTPALDLLHAYTAVVWYTGLQFDNTLSTEERTMLASFLDGGGKLFLSGKNIAERLDTDDENAWLAQYLHAEFVNGDVGLFSVQGVAGDPISDTMDLELNREARDSDEIAPTASAEVLFTYLANSTRLRPTEGEAVPFELAVDRLAHPAHQKIDQIVLPPATSQQAVDVKRSWPSTMTASGTGTAAVRVDDGQHKLVYLAFGFEAIEDLTLRNQLLDRILTWFLGETNGLSAPSLHAPVSGTTPTSPRLQWIAVEAAASYQLQLSKASDFSSIVQDEPSIADTSWTLTNLDEGIPYYWRVRARNALRQSQWSRVGSFQTNRSPSLTQAIDDVELLAGGSSFSIPLYTVFFDADEDSLTFSALSSDETLATATVFEDSLFVTALKVGTVVMTVSANDAHGGNVSTSFTVSVPTGVAIEDQEGEIPPTFALEQNYPNPFNPTTTIRFALPKPNHVTLKLYNVTGAEVAILVDARLAAGRYNVRWNAARFSSGVYLYVIRAGDFIDSKKLLLLK